MVLDFAGNDVTEFLHTLLVRTNFPYREANLARWADYNLMEELKERMVVLSEVRAVPEIKEWIEFVADEFCKPCAEDRKTSESIYTNSTSGARGNRLSSTR